MATTERKQEAYANEEAPLDSPNGVDEPHASGLVLNASGHVQEVERNFSLLSLAATGVVTGSEWPALGGSILVAIYNGGPPGVIYEFIASTVCYLFVYAAIAELASSLPSSAGVYHWASIGAGPRWGKACGFVAGWWNFFGWVMGSASMSSIAGNIILSMVRLSLTFQRRRRGVSDTPQYALFHPEYEYHRWHVFIVYIVVCWSACSLVAFANRALPTVNNIGLVFIVGGCLITVLVCAIVPGTSGNGYASSDTVWRIWENGTGYSSNGFVFLAGMLNGAYAVGTPDVCSHLSEEIPNPRVNVPKAMLAQLIVGTITAFAYIVTLFYSISDFAAISEAQIAFPVAVIYQQATNSRSGAIGLLVLILIPILCTLTGTLITSGRVLWTLGRDGATPYSSFVGRINKSGKNPMNATLICGVFCTILGAIFVGSLVAFNAFVGSFVILTTASYVMVILPNIISHGKYMKPGPFHIKGWMGYAVRGIACAYIFVSIVIFLFPFGMPLILDSTMNWAIAIVGGESVFIGLWYWWKRSRGYDGPLIMQQDRLARANETKHGEIILDS